MEPIFISTMAVAIAEMGDKTQLLAIILAARFKRPLPIILGILVATLANHALAAGVGVLAAQWLGPEKLRWVLGLSFLVMAAWIMVPDKADDDHAAPAAAGAFMTTLIAFFLVEMGDKTQIATVALSARFQSVLLVTVGTTLGMMLANVPAVLVGDAVSKNLPMRLIHGVAALIFAAMGLWVLLGSADLLGAVLSGSAP